MNLFVLFEQMKQLSAVTWVLEDWIYLYYLNINWKFSYRTRFLRIEFICIIWTYYNKCTVFIWLLRIEFICIIWTFTEKKLDQLSSWGLNLFVLFEPTEAEIPKDKVLEDWIYLYYLNINWKFSYRTRFLRIEFICIIWTYYNKCTVFIWLLRIEFICIIWTSCNSPK